MRFWLNVFPNVQFLNLISPKSDHSPLLLLRNPHKEDRRHRSFKFENVWLTESNLPHAVHEGWYKVGNQNIVAKHGSCAYRKLKFRDNINAYRKRLEQMRHRKDYRGVQLYNKLSRGLSGLIMKEENFWKQRSKKFWLKDGDLNTKFFTPRRLAGPR